MASPSSVVIHHANDTCQKCSLSAVRSDCAICLAAAVSWQSLLVASWYGVNHTNLGSRLSKEQRGWVTVHGGCAIVVFQNKFVDLIVFICDICTTSLSWPTHARWHEGVALLICMRTHGNIFDSQFCYRFQTLLHWLHSWILVKASWE